MTFGQALRRSRLRGGFRQKDIAAKVGMSVQYYCDLEHDKRGPPPDHVLMGLQGALPISLDYLYFLAGRLPRDVCCKPASEAWVISCFEMMRRGEEVRRERSEPEHRKE